MCYGSPVIQTMVTTSLLTAVLLSLQALTYCATSEVSSTKAPPPEKTRCCRCSSIQILAIIYLVNLPGPTMTLTLLCLPSL